MIPLPIQHIKSARANNKYLVLQNLTNPPIGWDEVWKDYLYSIDNNQLIKRRDHGFVTHTAHISIPNVKKICDEIGAMDAHIYVAFCRHDSGSGKHKDSMDVLYIQCVGVTTWEVDDNIHLLNPGDAIFVPKNKEHNVNSITARVGLSIGIR